MRKRNMNAKLIVTKLRENGPSTKYTLADLIGTSIPTVTTNINNLLKEGLLNEVGVVDSEFGRKPVLIDINYNKYFTLGINIQSKHLYYCLMNLELTTVLEDRIRFTDDLIADIQNVLDKVLEQHDIQATQIKGIGISYPGVVNDQKLILGPSPIVDFEGTSFTAFAKTLDMPIKIGNEANLAAYAENILGASKGYTNTLYLSINEGIGSGIIVDKKYYTGSHHRAGEIGHMVIEKDGLLCGCGAKGCCEAYLSTRALIQSFNDTFDKKVDSLEEVFSHLSSTSCNKDFMDQYLDYLALTLNNLFLIFDPDCIIIGGELSLYQADIQDYLLKSLSDNQSKLLSHTKEIAFSNMGSLAPKYGAALLCMGDILLLE